jgi:hypothetical protein
MTQALVDSSFLYAVFEGSSNLHFKARASLRNEKDYRIVPVVVLTEVAYLLRRRGYVREYDRFLAYFASERMPLIPVSSQDLQGVRDISQKYAKANFDFVDCYIMAMAERLNITRIYTFDQRDFNIYLPKNGRHFELVPY